MYPKPVTLPTVPSNGPCHMQVISLVLSTPTWNSNKWARTAICSNFWQRWILNPFLPHNQRGGKTALWRSYSNREPPGGVMLSKKQPVNPLLQGITSNSLSNVKELSKSLQKGSPQGDLWPPGRTLGMAERSQAEPKKLQLQLIRGALNFWLTRV